MHGRGASEPLYVLSRITVLWGEDKLWGQPPSEATGTQKTTSPKKNPPQTKTTKKKKNQQKKKKTPHPTTKKTPHTQNKTPTHTPPTPPNNPKQPKQKKTKKKKKKNQKKKKKRRFWGRPSLTKGGCSPHAAVVPIISRGGLSSRKKEMRR